jgi:hypothetical protein
LDRCVGGDDRRKECIADRGDSIEQVSLRFLVFLVAQVAERVLNLAHVPSLLSAEQ